MNTTKIATADTADARFVARLLFGFPRLFTCQIEACGHFEGRERFVPILIWAMERDGLVAAERVGVGALDMHAVTLAPAGERLAEAEIERWHKWIG